MPGCAELLIHGMFACLESDPSIVKTSSNRHLSFRSSVANDIPGL